MTDKKPLTGAPPLKEGEDLMDFIVREGCSIADNDGKRRNGGDSIKLTKRQARFFLETNRVLVDLGDDDDNADNAGITAEGSDRDKAERGGASATGSVSVSDVTPPSRKPS